MTSNFASPYLSVYLQAEQHSEIRLGIGSYYVRTDGGDMVPLESLVRVAPTTSAQTFDLQPVFARPRSNGQAAPGISSDRPSSRWSSSPPRCSPRG